MGYHNNPEATEEVIFQAPLPVASHGIGAVGRFFRTGDLGKFTSEGNLIITGESN